MRDLNLIPKSYLQQKKKKSKKKMAGLLGAAIAALIVGVTVGIFVYGFMLKSEVESKTKEIAVKSGLQQQEAQMNVVREILNVRENTYKELESMKKSKLEIVTGIETALPDSMNIESYALTGDVKGGLSFQIVGKSQTDIDVVQFVIKLKQDPKFTEADIGSLIKLPKISTNVKFTRNGSDVFEPLNDPGYSYTIKVTYGR